MQRPLLHDAVTLRHFGVCHRLDICESLHAGLPSPHWTEEVQREIHEAALHGHVGSVDVAQATWLGSPVVPTLEDQKYIYAIQVMLNLGPGPAVGNRGESESIYFAAKYEGIFLTDDNSAYQFAAKRLGPDRVVDTVDVLRQAQSQKLITAGEAVGIAVAIRTAGRFLRRVHPLV